MNYREAIRLKPVASLYNSLGYCYMQMKEYDKAKEQFNKAIELEPDFSLSYINLGIISRKNKDYDSAIEYFKKAIELDHKAVVAYNSLAVAYAELKQFDQAKALFLDALAVSADFEDARINLEILERVKNSDSAKEIVIP
jgi:tetratricopeptide (TPR) repeat protein